MVETLARELASVGLQPPPFMVDLVSARVMRRGEQELVGLPVALGDPQFRGFCIRNLGLGCCLTEFLISGLHVDPAQRAWAATLGGIANLIISGFDSLIDSGMELSSLSLDRRAPAQQGRTPAERLIRELIALYLARLHSVPAARPGVLRLIDRAIRIMYEAEIRSTAKPLPEVRSVWWRKSALPFAVMGMPAWLSEFESPLRFQEHLMWLCRVGEFFGWLDDFADYEDDRRCGQLNRISTLLRLETNEKLVRKVANQGKRVIADWDRRNRISPARDTFIVIVWTWLGNPKER